MDLSRQEYPAMLTALQPSQAVTVLNDRMRHVETVNTEIADWLEARRQLEDAYVSGLRRLARKQLPGESSDLGIFSAPWSKIVNSAEAIADSHFILTQKIETEVERPLRSFASSNRDVQAMTTMQGNLAAMAKEYDTALKKAGKLKDKGGKASVDKVASASSEIDSSKARWDSQAPYAFEKLQTVDETRFNHLRDVLTQFQTLEVDQVERNRVTAEQCLNTLLNVETADEIKTFSIRTAERRRRSDLPEARTANSNSLVPTLSNPSTDDRPSLRAPSRDLDSGAPQEEKKSGIRGLRRLGTVMGRRKSGLNAPAPPPKKKSSKLGNEYSAAAGSESHGEPLAPTISDANWRTPSPGLMKSSDRGFESAAPAEASSSPDPPSNVPVSSMAENPIALPNGTHQSDLRQLQEPLQPSSGAAAESTRDADGFNVPASTNDPISQAQEEAAGVADPSAQALKVDIRNAPIQEESADNETALATVANTLKASAPSRRNGAMRGRRDVRNTVFLPAAVGAAAIAGTGVAAAAVSEAAPLQASPTPLASPLHALSPPAGMPSPQLGHKAMSGEDAVVSDTQSVRSAQSLGNPVRSGSIVKHAEMRQPGLNCSMVETVSAWLEQGTTTKVSVIGELALVHNPTDGFAAGPENIRIENFQVLEKVAPNPAFVSQLPGKPGEYAVDTTKLNEAAVAFKYQLHVAEEDVASQAPLQLMASWKVEPTQTSMILSYSLDERFTSASGQPITFSNLIIAVYLSGAKASSCLSKPAGTFAREKSVVYWKLSQVTLAPGAAAQKLLARFRTDDEAKPGHVEARWEIAGEQARGLGCALGVSLQGVGAGAGSSDPFADDEAATAAGGAWKTVPLSRKLTSGTYTAV